MTASDIIKRFVQERRAVEECAKEIWCDDMGSRKFGPWEEIQTMSWPDNEYVRYGVVYTDRKVHGVKPSLPLLLKAVEEMAEVLSRADRFLDGIKYELEASVYTLIDDEFEKVFAVRDDAQLVLSRTAELLGGEKG